MRNPIEEAYIGMLKEAVKKKMDPVGKADADIDNDGDVDKSDEYLHNRRKAIKKYMKNEDRKECPKCDGEGCKHCDDKGYHEVEEAIAIDPDDGEVSKAKDKDKKKKKPEEDEVTDVEEKALTVALKSPTKVDDTEEKGHQDAVKAGKAGPGPAKKPMKKFKEMRKNG